MERSKENHPPLPSVAPTTTAPPALVRQQLSAEQKWRIDQNFRAAKAILSRKRPHPIPANSSPAQTWLPLSPLHKKHANHTLPPVGMNNTPIADHNSSCISSSGCPTELSHSFEAHAPHVLRLKTTVFEDFDLLDDGIFKHLDTLCKPRSPLAQFCVNRPFNRNLSTLSSPCGQGRPLFDKPFTTNSSISNTQPGQIKQKEAALFSALEEDSNVCSSTVTASMPIGSSVNKVDINIEANGQPSQDNMLKDSIRSSIQNENFAVGGGLETVHPLNISDNTTLRRPSTVCLPTLTSERHQETDLLSSPELSLPSVELMPAYLQALNDSQRQAVLSDTYKPLLILAGPGSGKTSTMVARLLRLLNEGVHAQNILAMTFTTAAASEMKGRVGNHVGKVTSKELNVCTFHSFCLQLCRSHAVKLGRSSEFLIYGRGQQRKAVVEATRLALAELNGPSKEHDHPEEDINPRVWKERAKKWDKFVTQAKASGTSPHDCEESGNTLGAAVLRNYNATLAACDALDYHDLISYAVALLHDNCEVLEECKRMWTCILVDEFQDTSTMQYKLLCLLASHKRVTVVGDDDQSIFSFNGANFNNFDCFRKDFSELEEVRLHQNYRSTRCIVEAASSLIGNNLKRCENKRALTENDFGDKVVEYIEKVANASDGDFLEVAKRIFTAKVSGRFSRHQLAGGRKVLTLIDAVHRLARKEHSLSALITTVMNLMPQKSVFQKRAIVDVDDGKFLNEDDDPRTVLEYLMDDVSDFLCNYFVHREECVASQVAKDINHGCLSQLQAFLDFMTAREIGNFKTRRDENRNSVTLTTMHQSKGLEWDTVFIVKANDSEIPLLHEAMGMVGDGSTSLEEERRLFYVAMTRARKKLYILYVTRDNQQLLCPTRFLRELPHHLLENQVDDSTPLPTIRNISCVKTSEYAAQREDYTNTGDQSGNQALTKERDTATRTPVFTDDFELPISTEFLRGFNVEARSTIAAIFHTWAKKPAFQDAKRLLDKVSFVLDERLRSKASKNKDTLRALKCSLSGEDAVVYARHVLRWVQMPPEERALLQSERQEFFQQKCAERSMGSAAASVKQISYLRSLGCTTNPSSRLHASRLIEQYKAL